MQNSLSFLPLVQKFILDNMPHGGFSFVSQRLNAIDKNISGRQVINELRTIKTEKETDNDVVYHSLMFLKDNGSELSDHCKDFIKNFEIKKAG